MPEQSVGIVTPQSHHFDQPIELACGRSLTQYDLVYETYGELNSDHSNAVIITQQAITIKTKPSPDGGITILAQENRSTASSSLSSV